MNLNNLEDLKGYNKDLGFPKEVSDTMESNIRLGLPGFVINYQKPSNRTNAKLDYELSFKKSGKSEYYFLNNYKTTVNTSKPLNEGEKYMVISPNPEKEGKQIYRKFENPHAAIKYFKAVEGNSELAVGKDITHKTKLASKGAETYLAKDFEKTYNTPTTSQITWIEKGTGFTIEQAGNMLEGGAVYRDDLLSSQGIPYKAWNEYATNEPRDKYGNYKVHQYNENYGFDIDKVMKGYIIKENDNPITQPGLKKSIENGNAPFITSERDGKEVRMRIAPAPQYKVMNFYSADGKLEKRQDFEKSPVKNMSENKDKGQGKQLAGSELAR